MLYVQEPLYLESILGLCGDFNKVIHTELLAYNRLLNDCIHYSHCHHHHHHHHHYT